MSPPNNPKTSWIQRNGTLCVMMPLILGLHFGWFALQQRYIPTEERHDHPITKLYKKYIA